MSKGRRFSLSSKLYVVSVCSSMPFLLYMIHSLQNAAIFPRVAMELIMSLNFGTQEDYSLRLVGLQYLFRII